MDILYITPYVPGPIRVRPYNLIRTLVQHNHGVTLATLWERPDERETLDDFRKLGVKVIASPLTLGRRIWNGLRVLPTSTPLQVAYGDIPALHRTILSECKSHTFDVIHVEHLRGADYGVQLKSQIRSQSSDSYTPIVWDSVDCISYLLEQAVRQSVSVRTRIMARLELGRTYRYEAGVMNMFDQVLVTSQVDRDAFEALADNHAPITVLQNGVDLAYYHPDESLRQPDTILFSGKMSYHANVTAALYLATQVMPLVWAQRPATRLVIAGSRPPRAIERLPGLYRDRIVVTGFVPDMRKPLHEASVAAAPLLYGAGVQNKVLEAMACGTPVVATPRSVAALNVRSGADCLVADSAESFAVALLSLLCDNAMRTHLGKAGRRYVEANHDWHTITSRLESIYDALLPLHGEPISLHEPYW